MSPFHTASTTAGPVAAPVPDRARRRRVPGPGDVRRLLRDSAPTMVAQPILDLAVGEVTAYEALARFPAMAGTSPQDWFKAAHRAGCGPQLEARAVELAIERGARRPADTVLSVNVSPNVLDTPAFQAVLPRDLSGLQFEITEHELADSSATLLTIIERLRRRGAKIAVDDVGEGYAGFKRLMAIRPDVLKIDQAVVAGVSVEPAKVAMLEAIVHFAARTGSRVCAEGLETVEDLITVADLDVGLAQGWLIGHPADEFFAASAQARAAFATRGGPHGLPAGTTARDVPQVLEALSHVTGVAESGRVIAGVATLLGCDMTRLAVLDRSADRLRTVPVERGESVTTWAVEEAPTAALVVNAQVLGQVLASTVCPDAGERHLLARAGSRSLLMLPLVSAGQTVGLMACFRRHERPWSRTELRSARTFAAAAGPVLASLATI